MENSKVTNQLYDAVDLLRMVEHIADGQATNGHSRQGEAPWGGIRLTVGQTQELILAAIEDMRASEEGDIPVSSPRPNKRRGADRREVETIVNPAVEYTNNESGARSSSLVRELSDNNSTGTFNRLQLPRESSASGEVL